MYIFVYILIWYDDRRVARERPQQLQCRLTTAKMLMSYSKSNCHNIYPSINIFNVHEVFIDFIPRISVDSKNWIVIYIFIPALSEERSGILLLPLSVRPSVRPKEKFVTGTPSTFKGFEKWYFRISFAVSCGCAITFYNFHFVPLGSKRGRKLTFSMVFLSFKLHQQFKKKTTDILGNDWPCPVDAQ